MSDTAPASPGTPAPKGGVDCSVVLEQLWEFLDEELAPERVAAIRTHLELCAKCYPDYDFEKAFLQAVSECQYTRCASHKLRDKVMSALKRAGFTPDSVQSA